MTRGREWRNFRVAKVQPRSMRLLYLRAVS